VEIPVDINRNGRTRVLVIEDDRDTRENLAALIEAVPGCVCSGTAHSRAAGERAILAGNHDLVLIDLQLGDGSGLDLIRLTRARTRSRTLVVTVFADRASVVAAVEAGVDGYLLKDSSPEELQRAISDVLTGSAPISPAVAAHLLRRVRETASGDAAGEPTTSQLTGREVDVLTRLARGYTYREVARQCGISHNTVAFHVKQIYDKLHANSRSEAVYRAINDGLISVG